MLNDEPLANGGDIGILDQLFALDRFPKARRHRVGENSSIPIPRPGGDLHHY